MKTMKEKDYIMYILFVAIGGIAMLAYIETAVSDVPALNDYIREINNYVGDGKIKQYVFSTNFFLQPPIKLFSAWINYNIFNMSVILDMFLGAFGLTLMVAALGRYCIKNGMNSIFYLLICIYCFSLSKWEMLINGTGWEHFWAFLGFILHFYYIDMWYRLEKKEKKIFWLMIIMPIINILGIAVFYGAVYSVVVTGIYLYIIIFERKGKSKKDELIFLGAVDIPMLVYVVCSVLNSDTRIVANGSIIESFLANPVYFLKFFIMSFSSEIIGIETIGKYFFSQNIICIVGCLVLCLYIWSVFVNIFGKIYTKSLMPLMLTISGFLNHCIVLLSRWGFDDVTYGMSSRYSLQYMLGGLGIFFTFFFEMKQENKMAKRKVKVFFTYSTITIMLLGNVLTTVDEIHKAPYRKTYYEETKRMILSYEKYSDKELGERFVTNGAEVRKAITILKEKQMSVWGKIPNCIKQENTISGRYADGWITREAEFIIHSGKNGIIDFDCYNPNPIKRDERITIEIDNEKKVYPLEEGRFVIAVPCEEDKILKIKVSTNFEVEDSIDTRERSFVLNNIYGN